MRQEKQYLLDEVKGQLDQYGTFVIMQYSGLTANAAHQFRRDVAKLGGNVEVMRKRILLKAAEAAGHKLELADLPGHVGVVFAGEDFIETAKLVYKYRQETDKAINVLGGCFEGKLYNSQDVEKLSKLPSKDAMRSELLATLEAPMSQTLAVMEALLSSVIYCLDNKSKEEAAPSETAAS
ncbi:50S ribosomal protein L10 [Chlamydiales bacterium STE3]|nr:50S ribosomal protein L10 [Chlamydiales bacterium STE3]